MSRWQGVGAVITGVTVGALLWWLGAPSWAAYGFGVVAFQQVWFASL